MSSSSSSYANDSALLAVTSATRLALAMSEIEKVQSNMKESFPMDSSPIPWLVKFREVFKKLGLSRQYKSDAHLALMEAILPAEMCDDMEAYQKSANMISKLLAKNRMKWPFADYMDMDPLLAVVAIRAQRIAGSKFALDDGRPITNRDSLVQWLRELHYGVVLKQLEAVSIDQEQEPQLQDPARWKECVKKNLTSAVDNTTTIDTLMLAIAINKDLPTPELYRWIDTVSEAQKTKHENDVLAAARTKTVVDHDELVSVVVKKDHHCPFCKQQQPKHSADRCWENPHNKSAKKQRGNNQKSNQKFNSDETETRGRDRQHDQYSHKHRNGKQSNVVHMNTAITGTARDLWMEGVEINGNRAKALFDTGSGISLIQEETLKRFNIRIKTANKSVQNLSGLFAMGKTTGSTQVTINWKGTQIVTTVHTVQHKLPADVLLSFKDVQRITKGKETWYASRSNRNSESSELEDLEETEPSSGLGQPRATAESSKNSVPAQWIPIVARFQQNQNGQIKGPCKTTTATFDTTDEKPVFVPQFPLSTMDVTEIHSWLDLALQEGIVEKTTSSWNHPIFVVRAPGRKPRVVINPTALNRKLHRKDIQYPMPSIFDFRAKIGPATWFSKLDLKSAFHQIEIDSKDRHKLAFSIKGRGQFCFARVPFGIASAPAIMQRVVDQVTAALEGVCCYMDDILVYAESEKELIKRTTELVKHLTENNLCINFDKSQFGARTLRFLGFQINENNISLLPETKEALLNLPKPKTVKQLQAALGAFNFARMHIPKFAEIAKPLYQLLETKPKTIEHKKTGANNGEKKEHEETERKNEKVVKNKDLVGKWNRDCDLAYRQLKEAVATAFELVHPQANRPKRLTTDASLKAVGACLEQLEEDNQSWKPVAFFSKKLSPAQQRYAAIQREALAIVLACEHFQPWLMSDTFHLRSDHSPLKFILENRESALMARWFLRLLPFRFSFEYLRGIDNALADMLSRAFDTVDDSAQKDFGLWDDADSIPFSAFLTLPSPKLPPPDKWNSLAQADIAESSYFSGKERTYSDDHYLQTITPAGPRIFVPKAYRQIVLQWAHDDAAHLGTDKTKHLIQSRFTWNNIGAEIAAYVQTCGHCQHTKGRLPNRQGHLKPIPVNHYNERWGMDFVQIGDQKLLTMVEYFTKYPVMHIVPDYSADTVIDCLQDTFYTYGFPTYVTHDRGSAFLSEKVQKWLQKHEISSKPSTAYHPQTDGLAERFNQTIIQMLRATESQGSFKSRLIKAVAAYRNSRNETTGTTPIELMFNHLGAPEESLVQYRIRREQAKQKTAYDKLRTPFDFLQKNDQFLIYNSHKLLSADRKTVERWVGPFVTSGVDENTVKYRIGETEKRVSRHLVKKYYSRKNLKNQETDLTENGPSDKNLDLGKQTKVGGTEEMREKDGEKDQEKNLEKEKTSHGKIRNKPKNDSTVDHPERFDTQLQLPMVLPRRSEILSNSPPRLASTPDPLLLEASAPSFQDPRESSSTTTGTSARTSRTSPFTIKQSLAKMAQLVKDRPDESLPGFIKTVKNLAELAPTRDLIKQCNELLSKKNPQDMRAAVNQWAQYHGPL